ncbi:MAG TPA: adenylate/guanylate cyclase with GAF sensor(s) [Cyanobacteria bacterium UBA11372]|nr:adenylate/guanylate cyclase with GAF sensor(s) [Cyanobacteria bacterium UBA11372]
MNPEQPVPYKGNILVVDDHYANLSLLTQVLSEQGYEVRVAPNGKLALKSVLATPPDLILLDIMMPEMDGYQVCDRLKANKRTREIPVIFLSALGEALDKVKAFDVGGVDYITKPFDPVEVLARIKNHLRLREVELKLIDQNALLQKQIESRRQAEVEIRLLLATTQAISRCDDVHSALAAVLRLVCITIQWNYGDAWIPSNDGKVLECSQGWYASDASFSDFRHQSLCLKFGSNVGLQGRIWTSKQPEWIEDIAAEDEQSFLRSQIAIAAGLKAAFGVPILVNDQVLAILIFYKKTTAATSSRLIELVTAVATQLGALIQRKQIEDTLRIAEERYHSIVENAVEGIYQATPSGRLLSANPALAKLYGYDSPTALMTSLQDISQQLYVDPNRRNEFVAAMETDNAVIGFESMIYRKDGQKIWISENARAVRDAQGHLLYYEGTVSDITARKLAQEALKYQKEQTERLLLNILPKPIAERLQEQPQIIADSFSEVSVLFADLVGFTDFSSQKSPTELVEFLNLIFSKFDLLSQKHGLEKIKTIGDAYMVVGGLPTYREDHAEAIARMALDMQASLDSVNNKLGQSFCLRIGINIGPVVAGVIGLTKFIYDLWGDTVNVASRMESSGIPGEIQVTSAVYERLKHKFALKKRGDIAIKGKGEMTTYFLVNSHESTG